MEKLLLDPHSRRLDVIFEDRDLQKLRTLVDIVWGKDEPISDEEARKAKKQVSFIVTGRWRYGSVSEDDAPNLRAILEVAGGHPSPKSLDYDTCFSRKIRVLSCAPAFAAHVAEMALGLAIATGRDIVNADRSLRAGTGGWGYSDVTSLYDQEVGFIGYGNLARALRPLLEPFRCCIKVNDPWLPETYLRRQGLIPVSLEELLETSKLIFVMAIPSPENKFLLSRSLLEKIQKDAVFVLVSRAHLVDFDALLELADQGRFKAAIDVYPEEPLPRDHPARKAKNVVLTPHLAGPPGRKVVGRMLVEDVEAMVNGLPPMNFQTAQPEIIRRKR
jgi:phosphoglycerate dehydrogenase-like enzyme